MVSKDIEVVFCSIVYPDVGGPGVYVYETSRALASQGAKVTVITLSYSSKRIEFYDAGVRVVRVPVHFPVRWAYLVFKALEAKFDLPIPELFWVLGRLDRSLTVWSALWPWRMGGEFTVVEFEAANFEGLLVALFRPRKLRTAVKLHWCLRLTDQVKHVRANWLTKIIYALEEVVTKKADVITAPSKSMAELAPTVLNLEPQVAKSITVIPNGVNTEVFRPSKHVARDSNTVLCVGRLEFLKGADRLAAAIPYVLGHVPAATFLFAGTDTTGPDGKSVMAGLQEQLSDDHRPRVEFLGGFERQELIPFYQRCAVAVFPSRYETFGYTCLEAMACGAPVVVSRVGGLAEMIEHGKTGLLVDADNIEELGQAIVTLLQNAELRRILGEAAVTRAREQYSHAVVGGALLARYQQLIAGTGPIGDSGQ
ncbi:MAG: glycosyltransferase family 4 protein [Gammaproteobacteria bacterium]